MKRYRFLIIMLVVSLLSFGAFYFMAVRGVLVFRDSVKDDARRSLRDVKFNFLQEIKGTITKLQSLAGNDVVAETLGQFELGESLQKGSLAFKQASGSLQFLERLRLVNMEDKIVIDTVDASLEGKKLLSKEKRIFSRFKKEQGGLLVQKDGRVFIAIPCKSNAGRYIGSLVAWFKRDLLLVKYEGVGTVRENYKVIFANGVLFYNLPRYFASKNKLAEAAVSLKRSSRIFYHGALIVVADELERFPFLVAFAVDRKQVGLPAIAQIILLLNGLIFLGLLSLLLLNIKTDKQRTRLNHYRETIDEMSGEIQSVHATADQVIKESELLESTQNSAGRKLSALPEQAQIVEQETVSLDQVLAKNKQSSGDVSVLKFKEKDDELQQLINQVAAHRTASRDEAQPPLAEVSATSSILGAKTIDDYWESIASLLHDTLKLSCYALLEPDSSGDFVVSRSLGFEGGSLDSFRFLSNEKIFTTVLNKKKVLFLKDKVLSNKTIRHKFPAMSEDAFSQMAIIPVIQEGELCALLSIFRMGGESDFDAYSLRELMYLSLL